MKKIFYVLAVATLFMASCSGAAKKEDNKAQKEITTNDSLATEAQKNASEIENSVNKVDSLVKDL